MKILQINSVCGYGSTGKIAVDLYKVYEEAGHECVIAYGRGIAPKGIRTIKIGSDFDMYMHIAKTRVLDQHGHGSKKATEIFIEKIKDYNPDIIHLHNIHGYYINIKAFFAYLKKENKKVVWTLHDCWAFTGHCAYFDYVNCNKWKSGCFECEQKKEYPKAYIVNRSQKSFEEKKNIFQNIKKMTIVTPSKWLERLVKESFLKEYNIKVINNGIDTNIFKYRQSDVKKRYSLQNKKIILGVASIWDRRKGLNQFIKLSEKLNKKYQIVLVGVTKKQIEKLPSNITGIERTNNVEELVELYSVSEVFINPTAEDNYPTTNLEALACGTPVITYNTGGSIEVINNKNGAIVNSVEEILEIIEKEFYVEASEKLSKEYYGEKYLELIGKL